MVEQSFSLDAIFSSLADPTRRDILQRLLYGELSVGEIAKVYDMSLAAVSKHIKILERASLIRKRRQGKQQVVATVPEAVDMATEYLKTYQALWEERFARLDQLLMEDTHHGE